MYIKLMWINGLLDNENTGFYIKIECLARLIWKI